MTFYCVFFLSYIQMATIDREVAARVVLQQCLHAKLQVKPQDKDSDAEWVEVSYVVSVFHTL